MLSIFTVLWPSKDYDEEYVLKLRRGVARNLTLDHRFYCLTPMVKRNHCLHSARIHDAENMIQWEPLKHYWPGWWSKVEAFDPRFKNCERIILMDLDMVVTGSLDEMFSYDGDVCVTKDFGWEKNPKLNWPSQTLMSFKSGAMRKVWDAFMENPKKWMEEGDRNRAPYFGDAVLWKAFDGEPDYYQDLYPGQAVSNRIHCSSGLPKNARLVSFHGKPKMRNISINWVSRNWI